MPRLKTKEGKMAQSEIPKKIYCYDCKYSSSDYFYCLHPRYFTLVDTPISKEMRYRGLRMEKINELNNCKDFVKISWLGRWLRIFYPVKKST